VGVKVAEDLLVYFLREYAILAASDYTALGAKQAARDARRLDGLIVLSIDGNPEASAAVQAGEMSVTING
jgi:ABC-type sugar transport system substrate-binding protein